MTDSPDTASRIAIARDQLTAKLVELRRRETHVRSMLSPFRYLANPWLHVAIAGVVGYRLGRPHPRLAAVEPAPRGDETLIHAVMRASMVAIAQALVRRAVASFVEER